MPPFPRRGGGSGGAGKVSIAFLLGACLSGVIIYTTTSTTTAFRKENAHQAYVMLQQQQHHDSGSSRALEDKTEASAAEAILLSEGYTKPFEVPEVRADLGKLLESEGLEIGAELGVQTGLFANITLNSWRRCKRYYMIDLWRKIPGYYDDHGNADDGIQSFNYWRTRDTLKPYEGRTQLTYLPMFTSEAVTLFPDSYFDYIYLDARHDYCGVSEDLRKWWPKLKEGGFYAGHDYVFAHEVAGQDWALCEDGSRNPGAVKGAVMEFALKHELKVHSIYKNEQPSWVIRKPIYKQASKTS